MAAIEDIARRAAAAAGRRGTPASVCGRTPRGQRPRTLGTPCTGQSGRAVRLSRPARRTLAHEGPQILGGGLLIGVHAHCPLAGSAGIHPRLARPRSAAAASAKWLASSVTCASDPMSFWCSIDQPTSLCSWIPAGSAAARTAIRASASARNDFGRRRHPPRSRCQVLPPSTARRERARRAPTIATVGRRAQTARWW